MKLTRGKLLKGRDWTDWRESEWKQLDQYEVQGMFGKPVKVASKKTVFRLVWTYNVKALDKRKKARCACDGSVRAGQVRVLDYTYAGCVDHTSSRMFYAVAAAENLLVYRADVTNAFGDAPPPKQGFHLLPDRAFHEWWTRHKGREPIPDGHVIPVLAAMQGHPEAPRLWAKHADKIIKKLNLKNTGHEPCLYSGSYKGSRVLLKRQVDDFETATEDPLVTDMVFDEVDEYLTFPLKRMGLVSLFNGVDVLQTRDYIKISVETYLERVCEKYLATWLGPTRGQTATPLPNRKEFIRGFLAAVGDPNPAAQQALEDEMEIT